jgi:small conductance mechanosensitive channel
MAGLEEFLNKDLLNPETLEGAVLYALVFLVAAVAITRLIRLAMLQALQRDHRRMFDRTVVTFLTQLVQIGVYLLALVLYAHLVPALRSLGTVLLASVSVASIIIGLAAQSTLSNLIAGVSLVLYRPFQVGDRIQLSGPNGLETGIVEDLNLGYTVLQTFDNRRVMVPNGVMVNQTIVNLTSVDARTMALITLEIGYASDIDRARQILTEVAREHPLVQEVVGCPVTRVDDSHITLRLQAWCADVGDARKVEAGLYEQASKRFGEEGIASAALSQIAVLHQENR